MAQLIDLLILVGTMTAIAAVLWGINYVPWRRRSH